MKKRKKSVKKIEKARAINKIETNLSKEKIDFINAAYKEEVDYWKRIALRSTNEEEMKKSTNLAPSRVFLICKDAGKSSAENIHEMIFYLKKNYSAHNREQARVDDIPQDGWSISFEEMSNHLKTYSKSVTEVENTTSKTKVLLRGWLSTPFKVYRRDKTRGKTLPNRFGDWIQRECGIAKQTIHNYKNLYKLMSIAPKLFNCRVNTTYFIKIIIFLLIIFETSRIHRGVIPLTAFVKIAAHTLQTQNIL